MDKTILIAYLGESGDFDATVHNLEGILRRVSDMPSCVRGTTIYHVNETLNHMKALSTIMET